MIYFIRVPPKRKNARVLYYEALIVLKHVFDNFASENGQFQLTMVLWVWFRNVHECNPLSALHLNQSSSQSYFLCNVSTALFPASPHGHGTSSFRTVPFSRLLKGPRTTFDSDGAQCSHRSCSGCCAAPLHVHLQGPKSSFLPVKFFLLFVPCILLRFAVSYAFLEYDYVILLSFGWLWPSWLAVDPCAF